MLKKNKVGTKKTRLAYKYFNKGDTLEASRLCQQSLLVNPDEPEANHLLGIIAVKQGKFEKGAILIGKSLRVAPDNASALKDLANAYCNLGIEYRHRGDLKKALECYQTAIKINPSYSEAHFNMGLAYVASSEESLALGCYGQAILLNPENATFYSPFCMLVRGQAITNKAFQSSPLFRQLILLCLSRDDVLHQDLFNIAVGLLLNEETRAAVECFVSLEGGRANFLKDSVDLQNLLQDELFLSLLTKTVVANAQIEDFLTLLRGEFLCLAVESSGGSNIKQYSQCIYALANQCFWNEYIFSQGPVDLEKRGALYDLIEGCDPGDVEWQLNSALLGCYSSLIECPAIVKRISECEAALDKGFKQVVQLQVENPAIERALVASIDVLSEISDETTKHVREQYEENPYPRWIGVYHHRPTPVQQFIASQVYPSLLQAESISAKPEVLVAGCGTGAHPISCALQYIGSSVLAVDISLSSLCYAKRKADEMKVKNIAFLQSDILELHKIDKTFDVIESVGVLHHMENPVKGWGVLAGLLKDDGYMKIALYSELAREHVVEARKFIQEQGYSPTSEGMQVCRQAIREKAGNDVWAERLLTGGADYYSFSAIRDLIFHVQEHRYSWGMISDILDELGLELSGIVIDGAIKREYLREFPEDKKAACLESWAEFETKNPRTFSQMYQFWVRKKR